MTTAILDVNGARYGLDYHGHDQPLHAWTDEHELRLSPWLLGQHLAALGQTTRVDDGALGLDAGAYAAQVLGPALQQVDAVARWGPLALWWRRAPRPRRRRPRICCDPGRCGVRKVEPRATIVPLCSHFGRAAAHEGQCNGSEQPESSLRFDCRGLKK